MMKKDKDQLRSEINKSLTKMNENIKEHYDRMIDETYENMKKYAPSSIDLFNIKQEDVEYQAYTFLYPGATYGRQFTDTLLNQILFLERNCNGTVDTFATETVHA